MPMILVCGEALVDLFLGSPGETEIAGRAVAGGSPFNVAIGIQRMGGQSSFCGGLSGDSFGQLLRSMLMREGVDLSHVVDSKALTTISVVATDQSGHPSYAFHGEGKADRMITEGQLPQSLPESVDALTFGSYTLAVDPVGEAYLAFARREARSRVISLDPNVRPTVTPDMAAWRRRFEQFLPLATLVKASDEDIALGYGKHADVATIAKGWLAAGPSLVVVTRGAAGATAFHANGTVSMPGRQVKVIDTVGAGDTFHAALLTRLDARGNLDRAAIAALSEGDIRDLLRHAITAASITCTRRGADLPTDAEVAAILEETV